MTPLDLKEYGRRRPLISRGDVVLTLLAIIVVLLAYWAVADDPDRKVITMTKEQFKKQIAAERIKAAREAMAAMKDTSECFMGWRSNPGTPPKGPM